jgi:glycosyltransferase involved in cell wall biosynthesis
MIIAQIVLDGAPEYERKSQRIDFATLSGEHQVRVGGWEGAEVAHVYAGSQVAGRESQVGIPFVSNVAPKRSRFSFRRVPEPRFIVTPFNIPEAVEDIYFEHLRPATRDLRPSTLGSFSRPSVTPLIEQTMARIHRFRDDVNWLVFTHPPSPEDFANIDVWVDPAVEEDDYDGFVAEGLVSGVNVVASRTLRSTHCAVRKGVHGFLVPLRDPNEMTHAILAALFKPEVARARSEAAQQTVSKYRSRHRLRALTRLYENLTK